MGKRCHRLSTKNGVMSGRRDGSFDPDATLTRAELAVLALKLDMILNKY